MKSDVSKHVDRRSPTHLDVVVDILPFRQAVSVPAHLDTPPWTETTESQQSRGRKGKERERFQFYDLCANPLFSRLERHAANFFFVLFS